MRYVLIIFLLLMLPARAFAQSAPCGAAGFGSGGNATCAPTNATQRGCINPVLFGADPTDAADSEPAFIAAENYALSSGVRCMDIPAGKFKLGFPWWIKGDSNGSFAVYGAGGSNAGTMFFQNHYIFVAPYNEFSGFNSGCGTGVQWSSPAVGSTGLSMCDNQSWWLDLKQVPLTSSHQDAPLNGLSQLDVQFWFNAASHTASSLAILTSSGTDGTIAPHSISGGPIAIAYSWNGSSTGSMVSTLNLSGGSATVTSGNIPTISGTWHFYEISYDGSNVRLFVDGTQSGSSTPATGTIIDKAYYNLVLGSGQAWPTTSAGGGYFGQVFGFTLSKTARNTSNYTAPTAILTCDSNTLLQIDGTHINSDENVSSTSGPFVQPECLTNGASTDAWMLMHLNQVTANLSATVQGLNIKNAGRDGYGIVFNQTNNSLGTDIYIQFTPYVGFLEENNSYFSNWRNLNSQSSQLAGAEFLWPGQTCLGCTFFTGDYPVVDTGGITYIQAFVTPSGSALGGLISLGGSDPNIQEELIQFQVDNENAASIPLITTNDTMIHVLSSELVGGIPSAFSLGNNVNLKIDSSLIAGSGTEAFSAGFGASSIPNTLIRIDAGQNGFVNYINNTGTLTDGKGEAYEISGMGTVTVTGTTAGKATFSCPQFTDSGKRCQIILSGYENTTGTAQQAMLPIGITAVQPIFQAAIGTCAGISFGVGSNSSCTSSAAPFPCCTGSGTGTCNTMQFVNFPASMVTTETGTCSVVAQ